MQAQTRIPKPTEPLQRTCVLSAMPVEALFTVTGQLPTASRVALAFVCKSIFTSLCPTCKFPQPKNNEDLLATLLLLEKDAPNWFLCFGCVRLRPLKRDGDGRVAPGQLHPNCDSEIWVIQEYSSRIMPIRRPRSRPGGGQRRCVRDESVSPFVEILSLMTWRPAVRGIEPHVPEISFSEGHQIMNRHFYGAPYGLPIQHLESVYEFERFIPLDDAEIRADHFPLEKNPPPAKRRYSLRPARRDDDGAPLPATATHIRPSLGEAAMCWIFTHRTSAKVIDDELYLCRYHSITGPSCCSQADFSRVIDSLELPVCRHILGFSKMPSLCCWLQSDTCIPELQSLRITATDPQYDVHPDNAIGSCIWCFTDYEIAIERRKRRRRRAEKLEPEAHHLSQAWKLSHVRKQRLEPPANYFSRKT